MIKGYVMESSTVCEVDDSGNAVLNVQTIHKLWVIKITVKGIFVFLRTILTCSVINVSGHIVDYDGQDKFDSRRNWLLNYNFV